MSGQEMLHRPGSSFPAHHPACLWWMFNPVWSRSCSNLPLLSIVEREWKQYLKIHEGFVLALGPDKS